MIKTLAACLLASTLCACSSLTAAGLRAVAGLDPVATDPARLTAAIGVNDAFRLRTGDAKLAIRYQGAAAQQPLVSEEFALVMIPAVGMSDLKPGPNEIIYLARIAEADLARARDAQARIKAAKQTGNGKGELTVSVSSGCLTRPMPAKVPVRTFLQDVASSKFVQLTQTDNVLDLLSAEDANKLRQEFPACSTPQG